MVLMKVQTKSQQLSHFVLTIMNSNIFLIFLINPTS